ncbi:MAG TPA: invasin [Gammaproteobacteria bacterium]|nr:invasin [Gammaproteobacteria bacterium]
MTKRFRILALFIIATLLGGCINNDQSFVSTSSTATASSGVASILLLVGSPQLGSSGKDTVTVTAIVKDSNNLVMDNIPVAFTADSGSVVVTQGTTDSAGQATATLSPGGDYTNRTITVTATAGTVSQSTTVDVTGTTLSISGENSVTINDAVSLTLTLTDSDNQPIANKTVTITSALGNSLGASPLPTDSAGQVQFTVTASNAGTDTITASAQGATATHTLTISADQFQITTPAAAADINLNTCTQVQLSWQVSGSPNSGQTVNFSATRGAIYSDSACTSAATSAVTNASGLATVYIQSSNAGPSVLTAYVTGGPSTSKNVNFVATMASSIDLQVDNATIGPNDGSQSTQQQATITATVRDANNNLVKGKVIRFSITQDNSGGTLTTATATTDSLGQASTTYVSSAATTAKNGVVITATVQDTPTVTGSISLTVAKSELFVRFGTGNKINLVGDSQYSLPYTVIVTDASGNPVSTNVNLSINPEKYAKGYWEVVGTNSFWTQNMVDTCLSEDTNENGILDSGEDNNGNGILDPGNVATVPGSVTTDANGVYEFGILYPRSYARWVYVRLTATTGVAGTESQFTERFWLWIAATDVNDKNVPPPGASSPFGVAVGCNNTN